MTQPPCSTDWTLVRQMMATAIDTCEKIESMGYVEAHRDRVVDVGGQRASVFEFMTSAWTMPETMRYRLVRARHAAGDDQPYVPEASRILVNMAKACAELVGSQPTDGMRRALADMLAWYPDHALPHLEKAIGEMNAQAAAPGNAPVPKPPATPA